MVPPPPPPLSFLFIQKKKKKKMRREWKHVSGPNKEKQKPFNFRQLLISLGPQVFIPVPPDRKLKSNKIPKLGRNSPCWS